MIQLSLQNIRQIFIRDFNLCFFVSLCILSLYPEPAKKLNLDPEPVYMVLPVYNGLFTALISLFLNRYFAGKNYTRRYYVSDKKALSIVAFIAGFLSIYITFAPASTYLISLIIIYIAYLSVKDFAAKLSSMLTPDTLATPQDIGEFANFFINLTITFAVINLSLNTIHGSFKIQQAFDFGDGVAGIVDALYFSIITMTTVGYGDIVPHTVIARIIVAFECLTSYLMFGIMIGIITRGISFNKK
ncbi:MAG: ion channel [Alphaproteobacteria bacterium]